MIAPKVHELAVLAARLRRIQQLGDAADPVERAAAIEAKQEIVARIEAAR